MLVVNILQRGIGFARNLAVCYFLSEAQLGIWGLASSFFCLAAPLAVLGLPGTFGRFVEAYRSRGQLARFLLMSMVIALAGYLAIGSSLVLFSNASSNIVFGESHSRLDMLLVTLSLGCIILFNAMTELVSGLRLPKTVSTMHAINSIAFTCLSLLGLVWFRDWRVLVIAFAGSAVLGIIPSIRVLLHSDQWSKEGQQVASWMEIAQRVLPFAASVWILNLLWNSFDLVDRYALLHFSSADIQGQDVHALVGQLHSGKLIPTLLSNLAVMLAGIFLPYLATDWERGRSDRVVSSLKTSVKFASFFLLFMSLGTLVASPFLFSWLLQGRYSDGLSILPKALTACCWMSVTLFLSNYFWCAERGRLLGILTAIALIVDIGLCVFWIPSMGLHGAMNANVAACGLLLGLAVFSLKYLGAAIDRPTCVFAAAPAVLLLGTLPAALVCAGLLVAASRTNWLLNTDEKRSIDDAVVPHLHRLGWNITTIWAR